MIPDYLQKKLQSGEAAYKTFMAGASQKSVIAVGSDRYIVIIGFTHFPYIPQLNTNDPDLIAAFSVTQMRISSDKSNNVFVIRNNIDQDLSFDGVAFENRAVTGKEYQENCLHLVHEDNVCIAFSLGTALAGGVPAVTPAASQAKQQTLGYGKEGDSIPALAVNQNVVSAVGEIKPQGLFTRALVGLSADQVEFPVVAGVTELPFFGTAYGYPLCLIKYIEIFGNPTNVQPSN